MKTTPQDIIIRPIVTERSMEGMQNKKYTFQVAKAAGKIEIARAIEQLFKVKVKKVNTMHCKGRYVRQGATAGYRPNWKKAIVTLTDESKTIEFFDNMF